MKYDIYIHANPYAICFQQCNDYNFVSTYIREKFGYRVLSITDESSIHKELHNQPVFENLYGPFYGGDGCVRYEDKEAYRYYST